MVSSIYYKKIKYFVFFITFLVLLFGGVLFFRTSLVKAELAIFYPDSCLGGWLNPHNAEKKPDVSNDNTTVFNANNSALLLPNTISNIFCGSFKGDIPKDSYAKKIILTLSWDITKDDYPQNISGENFASSSREILDSNPQTPFTLTSSTTDNNNSSSGESVQDNTSTPPEPAVIPENSEEAPAESSPQTMLKVKPTLLSFFSLYVPKAFAAEENVATSTETSTTTNIDTISVPPQDGNKFLEVLYTIDSTNWKSLGTVDAEHLRYSTFEIPLITNTKWSDMSNIQINIKSLSSVDHSPGVYLDGMSLQVSYGKTNDGFVSASGLYIPQASSQSPDLNFNIRNNDKKEELVIKSKDVIGNVAVFNASTSILLLTTFVEGGEYIIQPEYFGKGDFIFIATQDPNSCTSKTLEECRASADFRGEGRFIVVDNNSAPESATSTPSSN